MARKKAYRVVMALTLVCAVAASLWFVSPVRALELSFPSQPSSGNFGAAHSFQVKVDITDPDVILPIESVNLYIYKSDARATYEATCEDLPLETTSTPYTSISGTGSSGTSGTISITATATNWAYGYGYGYAVWQGYGYRFFQPGGYGYGYGSGTGSRAITYDIEWTSPTDWAAGNYKVDVDVVTSSKTFNQASSEFTLSTAGGGGGGGGGGGAAGFTSLYDTITTTGRLTGDVVAESDDGEVELFIPRNTIVLTETGRPPNRIIMRHMEEPPEPPADAHVIGLVYDFTPDGVSFSPPATLTFTYDPEQIPEGVAEESLVIAVWDEDTGQWVNLECTVDPENNTISAQISHFTIFTVLAYTIPAAFTTADLGISPAEVDPGDTVTISASIANTGSLSGSTPVALKIDNAVTATQSVTLAGGASQQVTFTASKDAPGTYSVNVNGLLGSFTVKALPAPPPTPATFTISGLNISPTTCQIGDTVFINALVANTGEIPGTYEVTLKIDNEVLSTKEVTIAGGASQKVTFTAVRDVPGTYTVDVNGLSGTITVQAPAPLPKPGTNWPLIGGIIAAAMIVSVVISLWLMRRRKLLLG